MCKLIKTDARGLGDFRVWVRSWAPLVVLLLLGACSNNATLEWTEDVKLPDGRVITLERYVEFKGGASQLGEPSTESLQRFKFRHPVTGEEVRWESTKELGRLQTVALWFDQERLLLLTDPAYGDALIKYKCPNPPYLLYEYLRGEWLSRPLAQVGIDRVRSNMTTYPLYKRQQIEQNKRRLSAADTSDSYAFRGGTERVPFIVEFTNMPEQTFRVYENCNRPLNQLIPK